MATLTVQGTGVIDNWIQTSAPDNNNGSSIILSIGEDNTTTETYRQLIKFDISSIPSNSTINSATLTMYAKTDRSDNARTIRVYRVHRAWTEDGSTWNSWDTGQSWGTAGCANTTSDREATDIGSATQPASPSGGDAVSITLTAAKIQEMITGGSFTNNGFLIKADTETDDAILYYSTDEATQTSYRPKLVVNYTIPSNAFIAIL